MSLMTPPDRFPEVDTRIPRFREAGDLTLDLFHRDARSEDCWLGLTLREFELLWRLAGPLGRRLRLTDLCSQPMPGPLNQLGDSAALDLAALQAKLAQHGLAAMLRLHEDGAVSLDPPPGPSAFQLAFPVQA